jgi:hypothetical protein
MLLAHDDAGSFGDRPVAPRDAPMKRLVPGQPIGPFLVEAFVGAGGMGEVYRAHDTRLLRSVALKVLPDAVAHDAGRRSRFAVEARALAALNHVNIAAIYGVEEHDGLIALVLELVEGPTLAETLAAGRLARQQIASTALQIAEALEAAHERGVVHRDLKPANIKITPDGVVKVLDFGLAVATGFPAVADDDGPSAGNQHSHPGAIVGTAAYMSPEQARGQAVDKRTDIWAFGCVLFEMGVGRSPFGGATLTDTLTAVIEGEPDWLALEASTPPALVRLIQRCLTRDPKQRLRDIGEARVTLQETAGGALEAPRGQARWIMGVAVAAALGLILAFGTRGSQRGAEAPASATIPVRFVVPPPEGTSFNRHPSRTFLALSPDGSQLAFIAGGDASRVWVRAMADLEPRPVAGTEGAVSVFWAPDGRSLAFFVDATLKRVDISTGAVVTIADVPAATVAHGTWGAGGTILMGVSAGDTIFQVPAAGGAPSAVLTPNPSNREVRVHWPCFLPDGRRFLYTARRDDGGGELRLGDLRDGGSRALMPVNSNTAWVEPDTVVFARDGVLLGQRVDLEAARPVGDPFSVVDRVSYILPTSRALFSASLNGTIAVHGHEDIAQLTWADQRGNELGPVGRPASYDFQSGHLASDERSVLTSRRQDGPGAFDIWRLDLVRGTEERLTVDRGVEVTPYAVDDAGAIVYAADRGGSVPSLFRKDLTTGREEPLLPRGAQQLVMGVLAREHAVLYVQRSKLGNFDIFKVPLSGGAAPEAVFESRLDKFDARPSPDGRAVAFAANDGATNDLYVTPLPVSGSPVLAASNIDGMPRWGRDGRRVYYTHDGSVWAVPVRTTPSFTVGAAHPLFRLKQPAVLVDVARDGRVLLLVPRVRAATLPIVVTTSAIRGEPS